MDDIKEYLKQTKTVLVTQDTFDELVKKASADERKIADLHKMVNYLLSRLEQLENEMDDRC